MKLIITEPGWETYTGLFGIYWFENGKSVTDVSPLDGVRTAAILKCVWADKKRTVPSLGEDFGALQATEAPIVGTGTTQGTEGGQTDEDKASKKDAKTKPNRKVYVEEHLGQLADKGGIEALREIATPMGVEGKTIAELISGILRAQAAQKAEGKLL